MCVSPQPNFGASLHILKVEIGGDAQTTGEWGSNSYSSVDVFDLGEKWK